METLAFLVTMMVAPSATNYDLEVLSTPSGEVFKTLEECQATASTFNKLPDSSLHYWCDGSGDQA